MLQRICRKAKMVCEQDICFRSPTRVQYRYKYLCNVDLPMIAKYETISTQSTRSVFLLHLHRMAYLYQYCTRYWNSSDAGATIQSCVSSLERRISLYAYIMQIAFKLRTRYYSTVVLVCPVEWYVFVRRLRLEVEFTFNST